MFDQKTTGYEWGSMGERRSITYPDGKKAVYSYDEAMKLRTLETAKGITEYSYDGLGRLCKKELPNDVTTTYAWKHKGNYVKVRNCLFTQPKTKKLW